MRGLVDPAQLELIGVDEANRLRALPMFRVRDTLTVAMAEPKSLATIDRLRELTNLSIRPILALDSNITKYIEKYATGYREPGGASFGRRPVGRTGRHGRSIGPSLNGDAEFRLLAMSPPGGIQACRRTR